VSKKEKYMTDCIHDWKDVYYGIECSKCGTFYPNGCEPWAPIDENYYEDDDYYLNIDLEDENDDDDPDSHSLKCTCESCIQNYPERENL
jgi:hypothetical protein